MTQFLTPITTTLKTFNDLCEAGTRNPIISSAILAIYAVGLCLSIAASNFFIGIPFYTPILLMTYHNTKYLVSELYTRYQAHQKFKKDQKEIADLLNHPEKNPARALQEALNRSMNEKITFLLNSPLITDQMFLDQLVQQTHRELLFDDKKIRILLRSDRIKTVSTIPLFNAYRSLPIPTLHTDWKECCVEPVIELISRTDLKNDDKKRVLQSIIRWRLSPQQNAAKMKSILKAAKDLNRTRAWDRRAPLLALIHQRAAYPYPVNQQ